MLFMLVGYMLYWRHRRRSLERMGDPELMEVLMPDASVSAHHWKFFLLFLGTILLIIAASGPRVGSKLEEVEHEGTGDYYCPGCIKQHAGRRY